MNQDRISLVTQTLDEITANVNGGFNIRVVLAFIFAYTQDKDLKECINKLKNLDKNEFANYFASTSLEQTIRAEMFKDTLKIAEEKKLNKGTLVFLIAKFTDDKFNDFYTDLKKVVN